jgi:hypothetical protein
VLAVVDSDFEITGGWTVKARRVGVRVQKESGGWVVSRIDSHAFPKRVLIAAFRSKDKAALFAKGAKRG